MLNCVVIVCAVKYERIKFLVIALPDSIDIYAWAPKPYHKFMVFKVGYQVAVFILLLVVCRSIFQNTAKLLINAGIPRPVL